MSESKSDLRVESALAWIPLTVQDQPRAHERRVTMTQIGQAAGVHNTTVSLALRNCPRIPEETRLRIKNIAQKMGYVQDPTLRALIHYRKRLKIPKQTHSIAYITGGASGDSWKSNSLDAQYHFGAAKQAAASGFSLEYLWLGDECFRGPNLSRVLREKEIGAMILANSGTAFPMELDWSSYSGVCVGSGENTQGLHCVKGDPQMALRLAVSQACAAGYSRVGIVLPNQGENCINATLVREFSELQAKETNGIRPIPPLVLDIEEPLNVSSRAASGCLNQINRWLRCHGPDALLSTYSVHSFLKNKKTRASPLPPPFINLFHDPIRHSDVAGVSFNFSRVGAVAVEILLAQIGQNMRGIPVIPTTTLIGATWYEGPSLVPKLRPSH